MGLTLSHRSALEVLRAARSAAGTEGLTLSPTELLMPGGENDETLEPSRVAQVKVDLGLPLSSPLDVMVSDASHRIRIPGIANHLWATEVTGQPFLAFPGAGIAIPSPELLVAQMAEVVPIPELIAIAHELCGKYTLRPSSSPLPAVSDVPAATSVEQIRTLFKGAKRLRGHNALRFALPRIRDDSLSPPETCLSTMVQLPLEQGGYQIGKADLNVTLTPSEGISEALKAATRTPDLLFRGTKVGINYDGDVHVDFSDVVKAATALADNPRSISLRQGLSVAIESARTEIAADKQRDRDLAVMGYTILPVTKQDMKTIDGLDLVMRQVMHLIEATTKRDMSMQRKALGDPTLKERREGVLNALRNL